MGDLPTSVSLNQGISGRRLFTALGFIAIANGAVAQGDTAVGGAGEAPARPSLTRVEEAAQIGGQILPPPSRIEILRKRAIALRSTHEAFTKKQEIHPHADDLARWSEISESIERLKSDFFVLEKMDPEGAAYAGACKAFFIAIQPLGPYLDHADYQEFDPYQSQGQLAEFKVLNTADRGPGIAADGKSLEVIGPGRYYTITNLSVPLMARAPAGATVYFETQSGGRFANGLPIASAVAGEDGIASAEWVTNGDAIELVEILMSSPQASSLAGVSIYVAKLVPKQGFEPAAGKPIEVPTEKPMQFEAPKIPHPYLPDRVQPAKGISQVD